MLMVFMAAEKRNSYAIVTVTSKLCNNSVWIGYGWRTAKIFELSWHVIVIKFLVSQHTSLVTSADNDL